MSFADQPPSKQWAALKYRGQRFAEVWFKPDGDPLALTFRIPADSFHIRGISEQLTLDNLLKAVALSPDEIASSSADLHTPLTPPEGDAGHLEIHVRVRSASDAGEAEISLEKWQDLENRWKTIVNLEAALDVVRLNMESLLVEMENAWKKPLSMEEKTYAPRADVAQLTKAKNRVHIALPKVREFIHRATWMMAAPERKRLGEIYDNHIQSHVPFSDVDHVIKQLEDLRKDRQVLTSTGKSVYQDCKALSAELQGALRTLQQNATKMRIKKTGERGKGKHF